MGSFSSLPGAGTNQHNSREGKAAFAYGVNAHSPDSNGKKMANSVNPHATLSRRKINSNEDYYSMSNAFAKFDRHSLRDENSRLSTRVKFLEG